MYCRIQSVPVGRAANDACWDTNIALAVYGAATLVFGGIALVLMVA